MSRRINYSEDGTIFYYSWNHGVTRGTYSLSDMQKVDDSIGYESDYITEAGYNTPPHYYFDFGAECTIDKIGLLFNYTGTAALYVSSDTTDGEDGNWTTAMASKAHTGGAVNINYLTPETPTAGTWARLELDGGVPSYSRLYSLHLFGSYTTPNFELWNGTGTSEITTENPLAFPDAFNDTLYDEDLTFTIKNTDSVTHSYSIEVLPATTAADSFVTTYFSPTPTTVTDLTAGSTSSAITINGNVAAINNPADGKHYIKVKVTETA